MKNILKKLCILSTLLVPFFSTSCSKDNRPSKKMIDEYTKVYIDKTRSKYLNEGFEIHYAEFKDYLGSNGKLEFLVFFDIAEYSFKYFETNDSVGGIRLSPDYRFKAVIYDNGEIHLLRDLLANLDQKDQPQVYDESIILDLTKKFNKYVEDIKLTEREEFYFIPPRVNSQVIASVTQKFSNVLDEKNIRLTSLILPSVNGYDSYFTCGKNITTSRYYKYNTIADHKVLIRNHNDFYLTKDDEFITLEDAYKLNKINKSDVNAVLDSYEQQEGHYAYWDSLLHFSK